MHYNYVIVGLSQDSQVTVDMSEEEADMDTAFDFIRRRSRHGYCI